MATNTTAPTAAGVPAAAAHTTTTNHIIRQAWACLRSGGPWPKALLPYAKALPSIGALGLVVEGMEMAFPPDLYQVLSSATPPTIEWLRSLSTNAPGVAPAPAWGVYMVLLEHKDPAWRPRLYIGSRTASAEAGGVSCPLDALQLWDGDDADDHADADSSSMTAAPTPTSGGGFSAEVAVFSPATEVRESLETTTSTDVPGSSATKDSDVHPIIQPLGAAMSDKAALAAIQLPIHLVPRPAPQAPHAIPGMTDESVPGAMPFVEAAVPHHRQRRLSKVRSSYYVRAGSSRSFAGRDTYLYRREGGHSHEYLPRGYHGVVGHPRVLQRALIDGGGAERNIGTKNAMPQSNVQTLAPRSSRTSQNTRVGLRASSLLLSTPHGARASR
ncbi:hypothetical protein QBC39DRAFT_376558 [Podospora conica]|nr:hypothetical protein QBC39DRAFT_376558 [Schizothecium conicum]